MIIDYLFTYLSVYKMNYEKIDIMSYSSASRKYMSLQYSQRQYCTTKLKINKLLSILFKIKTLVWKN